MTPRRKARGFRDHGRGTIVIDRVFPGLGRIKRASGTRDLKIFELLYAMLGTLYDAGRLDLLRAIKTGTLTTLEVWEHFRTGQLQNTPTAETMKPLRRTMTDWVARYKGRRGGGIHERHRYELRKKLEHLAELGTGDSTIAELPRLLSRYRANCLDAGTHRTFNYAKSAALAFTRAIAGRTSPLYQAVSAIDTLTVTATRRGNPQTVEAARQLRSKLPPLAAIIWWTMCCTGMGPDEFWGGKWEVYADRTRILGSKRERRLRWIPKLVIPVRPDATTYRRFATILSQATEGAVEPYDGRRTFAHWLELAGIPRTRRKAYMGHAGGDVLSLYEAHEVAGYLAEDTAKLVALIGDEGPGLKLVQGGKAS